MSISTIGTNIQEEASTCKLPFFEPTFKTYPARSSIAHPQLRDLLICPTEAHHVQTVSGYGIDAHVIGKHTMRLMESATSFLPNCLVSGCNYVASGGGAADLLIRSTDVQSRWELKVITGQSIVNSVHFFQQAKYFNPQILVCNNDQTITQYELSTTTKLTDAASGSLSADPDHHSNRFIRSTETDDYVGGEEENLYEHRIPTADEKPSLSLKSSIFLPVPVNHCSFSPDSRSMVAVGDSNEVFLYDCQNIRSTNEPLIGDWRLGPRKITLPGVSPHVGSFSTSWNQTGDKFAVASEGAVVVVYDMKMLSKPLLVKRSCQRGRAGSARVVKFSPAGPNELLAFTEHQLYVHVLDARTFDPDHEQLLKVPTPFPGMTTFPERIERTSLRPNRSTTNSNPTAPLVDRPGLVYEESEPSTSSRRGAELNSQFRRGSLPGNSRPRTPERMEEDEDYEFEPVRDMSFGDATFELSRRRSPEPALSDRIWGEIQSERNQDNQGSSLSRRGNHVSSAGSRGVRSQRSDGWIFPRPTNYHEDEVCLENEGETSTSLTQSRQIGSTSRSTSVGTRLGWGAPTNSAFSFNDRQIQVYPYSIRVASNVENDRNSNSNNNLLPSSSSTTTTTNTNNNNTTTTTNTGLTQHRAPSSSTIANIHSRLINNRLGTGTGPTTDSFGIRYSNALPTFIPFTGVGVRSGMWDDLIGLAWSPDGHWLVSGTEVGLVEWKVDLSSRSAFGDSRLC